MLTYLAPDRQIDSVLKLTVEGLDSFRLKGLLLDLDCTLKDYHTQEIPTSVLAWVEGLRAGGIRLCLLSNGRARRVQRFATNMKIPFVAKAFKPLPFGCHRGLKELGLPRERVAMVGDQLFADILAGRLAGLFTILVRPTSPVEPWFTKLKRPFERLVLRWLNRRQNTACQIFGNYTDQMES